MSKSDFSDQLQALTARLNQKMRFVVSEAEASMGNSAEMVAETVEEFVPYDTGSLERSVFVDASSTKNGTVWTVGIDGSQAHPATSKVVGDYAEDIHDNQEPWGGVYKRGSGTVAKGEEAGGGFMPRAFDVTKDAAADLVRVAVQQSLHRG